MIYDGWELHNFDKANISVRIGLGSSGSLVKNHRRNLIVSTILEDLKPRWTREAMCYD